MFNRTSFPTAIAHVDCNSFFASVEQAYNPKLKNKPILVTGLGGGCVITASYEARKFGISTGTTVKEAKKLCPQAIIVPANFQHYQIFNQNLIKILKDFTPDVEPASIDECYLDLKGLRRLYRQPYSEICWNIKETIKQRLGITVSVGLSSTKLLAKIGSNYKKPDGLTVIGNKELYQFLSKLELRDIKGLGPNTRALLNKKGIHTPLEFSKASPELIKQLLGKTGIELQMEINGYSIRPVTTIIKPPKSLARTRSFKVTSDQQILYEEALNNLTLSFWHLRQQNLKTHLISIMLRDENYQTEFQEISLPEDLNSEINILKNFQTAFHKLFQPGKLYRSTGIITTNLTPAQNLAPKLFPNELETQQQLSLFQNIDKINQKYGSHTITLAPISHYKQHNLDLRNLAIPYLGTAH